jgi:hypothetical protein
MKFASKVMLGGKTATGIEVPSEVVESLGSGKRVPVNVTVGTHTYRTTVAPYGGAYFIPLSAENREAAGVAAGDDVVVEISLDAAPRVMKAPPDLVTAFKAAPGAAAFFESLSYSHKRAYVDWIISAKKDETRERRVAQAVEMLLGKQKR